MTMHEERRVLFEGASNFRDLGGYETKEGGTIKWKRVYRSNSLSALTDPDLDQFQTLGIRVVCDFRRDEERDEAPSRLPAGKDVKVVHFSIGADREHSALYDELQSDDPAPERVNQAMKDIYRSYALDHTEHYARFLEHVAERDHLPLLFHCAAGKDRTGFGAAVLMEVLGVPRETIYADFDLTNEYLVRDMDALQARYPNMKSLEVFHTMLSAHPDYLGSAYGAIEGKYGDFETYIAEGLGVTPEKRDEIKGVLLDR